MCAEASTILRAVAADFFFNCYIVIFIRIYFCGMAHYAYFGLAQRMFVEW
jgi:hypothetical protein